jgi:2-polyprenyl-3-methyl-5-hydroxy-6-metoxy-1,4-benzoquinol methylase
MAYTEEQGGIFFDTHFPHAGREERRRTVADWAKKSSIAEGIARDFERRVRPLAGLRVLDAGSGNGAISIALAARGASVDGVEIEEDLVAIARAEAAAQGSSARFTYYGGRELPFADRSFDAALSVSVIEHVEDPAQYLSEILRVLKPDGAFYLAFPNRLYPEETHTGLWGLSYLPRPLAQA